MRPHDEFLQYVLDIIDTLHEPGKNLDSRPQHYIFYFSTVMHFSEYHQFYIMFTIVTCKWCLCPWPQIAGTVIECHRNTHSPNNIN